MDQGHGLSRLPGQGTTLGGECRSCAIAQWAADDSMRSVDAYVAEDVDDDVVISVARSSMVWWSCPASTSAGSRNCPSFVVRTFSLLSDAPHDRYWNGIRGRRPGSS